MKESPVPYLIMLLLVGMASFIWPESHSFFRGLKHGMIARNGADEHSFTILKTNASETAIIKMNLQVEDQALAACDIPIKEMPTLPWLQEFNGRQYDPKTIWQRTFHLTDKQYLCLRSAPTAVVAETSFKTSW